MAVSPELNELTRKIIGCAIEVHTALGPGLLESAYHMCLLEELRYQGLKVETRVRVPISYRGRFLECGYQLDMVVESLVILELKALSAILAVHEAQLVTYLKLTGLPVACC